MSRLWLVRSILSISSVATVTSILASSPDLRSTISRLFSPSSHPVRFGALLLALVLNARTLPFVWHIRFVRHLLQQVFFQPKLPRDALFTPIVLKGSYPSLNEMDYNFHMSNSEYFASLDMGRIEIVGRLLQAGIKDAQGGKNSLAKLPQVLELKMNIPKQGGFNIFLGGVTCHFKKEIKPYQRFDIWTRILTWDTKWVYVVSHLVKPGVVHPGASATPEQRAEWKNAIFASSISKFVVKKGRFTLPPEIVFYHNKLMPQKTTPEDDPWNYEFVEKERQRGMELAEGFARLEGLHEEFPVAGNMTEVKVLSEHRDYFSF